jgi:hypothetical protein
MDIYTSVILAHYFVKIHKQSIGDGGDSVEWPTQTVDRPIAGLVGMVAAIGIFVIALNLAA